MRVLHVIVTVALFVIETVVQRWPYTPCDHLCGLPKWSSGPRWCCAYCHTRITPYLLAVVFKQLRRPGSSQRAHYHWRNKQVCDSIIRNEASTLTTSLEDDTRVMTRVFDAGVVQRTLIARKVCTPRGLRSTLRRVSIEVCKTRSPAMSEFLLLCR